MRRLSDQEIEAFLDSKQAWMILTTHSPEGYPHSVPMGYFVLDGEIWMGCKTGTQKLKNIERDPRVCLLLENGRTNPGLTAVMWQGEASIVSDPEELLKTRRRLAERRGQPPPDEVRPGFAYIRVRPVKTISWDRS